MDHGWSKGYNTITYKKCTDISKIMRKLLKKHRVTLNEFQKLSGKLQHASMGIQGGRSLFTPIDMTISGKPYFISITSTLRQCLEEWWCLIQCMPKTPTSVPQLVVSAPTYISYTYACSLGAGGVWYSGTKCMKPFLCQVE